MPGGECDSFCKKGMVYHGDYGKGLHEVDIPNIFDRFYQPKETKANHNGIGLNLSKLIREAHQGNVYVYNHANGSAVFRLNLPVYELLKFTKV
uniref:ATP-binding protein n=1 Tax=Agathobacter sp. TaxID=2021311 RepID=UPI00405725AF